MRSALGLVVLLASCGGGAAPAPGPSVAGDGEVASQPAPTAADDDGPTATWEEATEAIPELLELEDELPTADVNGFVDRRDRAVLYGFEPRDFLTSCERLDLELRDGELFTRVPANTEGPGRVDLDGDYYELLLGDRARAVGPYNEEAGVVSGGEPVELGTLGAVGRDELVYDAVSISVEARCVTGTVRHLSCADGEIQCTNCARLGLVFRSSVADVSYEDTSALEDSYEDGEDCSVCPADARTDAIAPINRLLRDRTFYRHEARGARFYRSRASCRRAERALRGG